MSDLSLASDRMNVSICVYVLCEEIHSNTIHTQHQCQYPECTSPPYIDMESEFNLMTRTQGCSPPPLSHRYPSTIVHCPLLSCSVPLSMRRVCATASPVSRLSTFAKRLQRLSRPAESQRLSLLRKGVGIQADARKFPDRESVRAKKNIFLCAGSSICVRIYAYVSTRRRVKSIELSQAYCKDKVCTDIDDDDGNVCV